MSHTPPVPQGNQSPYPLQPPAHADVADTLPPVATADAAGDEDADDADVPSVGDRLRDLPLGKIGAAMGIGATLIAGVLLGLRGRAGATAPKRRRPRKR